MNTRRYKFLVVGIAFTVLLTVGVQIYWNINHFRYNREQFDKQLQLALDNAFDGYYGEISKSSKFAFFGEETQIDTIIFKSKFNLTNKPGQTLNHFTESLDSVRKNKNDSSNISIEVFRGNEVDSIFKYRKAKQFFISINLDTLKMDLLYDYIVKSMPETDSSSIYIKHIFKDTLWYPKPFTAQVGYFQKTAQSGYLKRGEIVELYYPDSPMQILKSSIGGIALSLLMTALVISALLLLLRIIRKQKLASEIKNDLISNITHEFKTPIATLSAALESFKSFHAGNNPQKSALYLNLSREQLDKLSSMVDRLLETATLETESLVLEWEQTEWIELIRKTIEKYRLQYPEKEFVFEKNTDTFISKTDVFHLENILNNLLDNAVKYGGDRIEIAFKTGSDRFMLSVSDNGNGIPDKYRKHLFEKFFRIPSGNTHQVKGYGIGLYYVKTLVEKMGGTLHFESDVNFASKFIIQFKR